MKKKFYIVIGFIGFLSLVAGLTGYNRMHLGENGMEYSKITSSAHRSFILAMGVLSLSSSIMYGKRREFIAAILVGVALSIYGGYYLLTGLIAWMNFGWEDGINGVGQAIFAVLIFGLFWKKLMIQK
jgi:hypothetical protein